MTHLLAIDPGAKSGFALFSDLKGWHLLDAWVTAPDVKRVILFEPDIVVIENPVIYPNSKARPKDILKLARIVGRYEERYKGSEQHLVEPRDWKGSIDGDIMTKRIIEGLIEREKTIASWSKFDHNMLDAVGLGKWSLRQPWIRVLGR